VSPELTVVLINGVVLLACYLGVLPRWAGADLRRIAVHDFMATMVALLIAASLYQGTDLTFNLGPLALNWFWFALLTYFALELPLMYWYLSKARQSAE